MLQPGDIILAYSGTFLDSAVDIVTDSPFSHAALVFDPVKRLTIEARAFSPVCHRSLESYKNISLVLRVPGLTDEQRSKVIQYAKSQLGKPYDYEAILEEFLRYGFGVSTKKASESEKFICSTLVTASYLNAGIRITDQPLAAPGDLFISKKLTIVGRLGVDC